MLYAMVSVHCRQTNVRHHSCDQDCDIHAKQDRYARLQVRGSYLQLFCRYPFDPRDGEPANNRSIVQRIIAGTYVSKFAAQI